LGATYKSRLFSCAEQADMRAEMQSIAEQIQQSLALLRRHL
jgi:hypothetical protein